MTGCFVGDYLNMKIGPMNLLRISGALVAIGFGFALIGVGLRVALALVVVAGTVISLSARKVLGEA
jgi:hypothetical protein